MVAVAGAGVAGVGVVAVGVVAVGRKREVVGNLGDGDDDADRDGMAVETGDEGRGQPKEDGGDEWTWEDSHTSSPEEHSQTWRPVEDRVQIPKGQKDAKKRWHS